MRARGEMVAQISAITHIAETDRAGIRVCSHTARRVRAFKRAVFHGFKIVASWFSISCIERPDRILRGWCRARHDCSTRQEFYGSRAVHSFPLRARISTAALLCSPVQSRTILALEYILAWIVTAKLINHLVDHSEFLKRDSPRALPTCMTSQQIRISLFIGTGRR